MIAESRWHADNFRAIECSEATQKFRLTPRNARPLRVVIGVHADQRADTNATTELDRVAWIGVSRTWVVDEGSIFSNLMAHEMCNLPINHVGRVAPAFKNADDEYDLIFLRLGTKRFEEFLSGSCGKNGLNTVPPDVQGLWKHDQRISDIPLVVALLFFLYLLLDRVAEHCERICAAFKFRGVKEPDLIDNGRAHYFMPHPMDSKERYREARNAERSV